MALGPHLGGGLIESRKKLKVAATRGAMCPLNLACLGFLTCKMMIVEDPTVNLGSRYSMNTLPTVSHGLFRRQLKTGDHQPAVHKVSFKRGS